MNKKLFFGILIPLLIIVVGVLIWQFCFNQENIVLKNHNVALENNTPIINPNISETDLATSDWYEYNIPPNYYVHDGIEKTLMPSWVKDIYFVGSNSKISTWTIFFYNALDNKIQKAYISTKTGTIAFVREIIKYENGTEVGSRSIYITSQDKQIKKLIGVTRDNTEFNLDSYGDISFSPDGKYISVVQYGYEWSTPLILDINTGTNIIADKNINAGLSDILWTEDNRYIAIRNGYSEFDGSGAEEIVLLDTQKNFQIINIFEIDPITNSAGENTGYQERINQAPYNYDTFHLSMFEPNYVFFSIIAADEQITNYKYNITTQKLEILKLKKTSD